MGLLDILQDTHPPLVEQALGYVHTMITNGHMMFAASTAHLLDNEILDEDLKALDEVINECEKKVRRVVLEHLAMQPKRDLVFCLKMISVVHEAERIGDLCKSLARMVSLAKKKRVGPTIQPLRSMRDTVLEMFRMMEEGFFQGDEATAQALMQLHQEMKSRTGKNLQEIAKNEHITPNEATLLTLGTHLIGRISSHLSNITSTVILPFDEIRNAPSNPN